MDGLTVAGPGPVVIEDSQCPAPNQVTLMFYRIEGFTARMAGPRL